MTTVTLPTEIETRIAAEASRRGVNAQTLGMALIEQGLPPALSRHEPSATNAAALSLLEEWRQESERNRTDDPLELARRQRDLNDFLHAIDRQADDKRETD